MKIGTKSLLFGVHQVFLHPLFVFVAWIKLYGWPNWKEIVCIVIHDWGYWGCGDMDGEEGERHTKWAALKALKYLDGCNLELAILKAMGPERDYSLFENSKYYYLCLCHSRFLSEKLGKTPSKLCWADKLGSALYPPWLWVLLGTLTGEIKEYMGVMKHKECIKIEGTNPFKYFLVYRDKVVPELLKENGLFL